MFRKKKFVATSTMNTRKRIRSTKKNWETLIFSLRRNNHVFGMEILMGSKLIYIDKKKSKIYDVKTYSVFYCYFCTINQGRERDEKPMSIYVPIYFMFFFWVTFFNGRQLSHNWNLTKSKEIWNHLHWWNIFIFARKYGWNIK